MLSELLDPELWILRVRQMGVRTIPVHLQRTYILKWLEEIKVLRAENAELRQRLEALEVGADSVEVPEEKTLTKPAPRRRVSSKRKPRRKEPA